MKTNELTGKALDWAVAKAEGMEVFWNEIRETFYFGPKSTFYYLDDFNPSTDWSHAGPIIKRENIEISKGNPIYFPKGNEKGDYYEPLWLAGKMHGTTPLITAMRCLVLSKLGDEIDIPKELL